jgi:hypothetical protein
MTQLFLKKARSIQELARKKFERLRSEFERSEKELKSNQEASKEAILPDLAGACWL